MEVANQTVTIIVRGVDSREAVLNTKTSQYSFGGLSPGEYAISARLPSGFASRPEQKVTVADGACAQVDWPIFYDSHIRGRVTEMAGSPVDKTLVVLKRKDSNFATGFDDVQLQPTEFRFFGAFFYKTTRAP